MAQITFTTKACPNWISIDARACKEIISTLAEVEKMVAHIKCDDPYLIDLIRELKINLSKANFKAWLKKKRNEFRDTVYLMSALDPLSTDSDEICKEKLLIGVKLIEIIEA